MPTQSYENETSFIEAPDGTNLAFISHRTAAGSSNEMPGLIFLGGFGSDMYGNKASFLQSWARENDREACSLDYRGHGASDGEFIDGTISEWAGDARHVFEHCTSGPQIIIGSSMGGWIALLLARYLVENNHAHRLAGLILLAPAPDFTQDIFFNELSDAQKAQLEEVGQISHTGAGDYSYVITKDLIADGRKHLLLGNTAGKPSLPRFNVPIRIVHSMLDVEVPWQTASRLMEALGDENSTLTLLKDGSHNLSRDSDLALMASLIERIGK